MGVIDLAWRDPFRRVKPDHHCPEPSHLFAKEEELENILGRIRETFIDAVSHEFRTPLTSIIGYSELMSDRLANDDLDIGQQQSMLQAVLDSAKKLEMITDRLTDLKQFDCPKQRVSDRCLWSIEKVIEDSLSFIRDKYPQTSYALGLKDEKTRVLMNVECIQKVLIEIITNAIKFSSNAPVIITGSKRAGNYCISVQDRGRGIDSDHIHKVFELFCREDLSTTAREGLGLGLSWAKWAMESHGGKISIKSKVGVGTQVTMMLPLCKA